MAIDRLNKVTILLPSEDSRWFISKLYQLNIIHIIESLSQPNDAQKRRHFPYRVEDNADCLFFSSHIAILKLLFLDLTLINQYIAYVLCYGIQELSLGE